MGAVRAGTLAAAAAACWLLSRAGGGFTPDELLLMLVPAGAVSEITASLMSLADRIIISGITKGDL